MCDSDDDRGADEDGEIDKEEDGSVCDRRRSVSVLLPLLTSTFMLHACDIDK